MEIFKALLEKHAKNGNMLYLEEASLSLAIDIIGRVVMCAVSKEFAHSNSTDFIL